MLAKKSEARLNKMEGTPGFPNQRLSLAAAPEEQATYATKSLRSDILDERRDGYPAPNLRIGTSYVQS